MQAQTVGRFVGKNTERLKAIELKKLGQGNHPDGAGLYLQVKGGGRSWLYRYELDGKERWMGLGSFPDISLAQARKKARDARNLKNDGTDPIEERRKRRVASRLERAGTITFREAADRYIKAHASSWKNKVHSKQWESTLSRYAHPVFGDLPVSGIQTSHILDAIEPIWTDKTETASRVRGRVEAILDWAAVRGYREKGVNPAQWRGHLEHVLPKRSKIAKVRHQPALHYDDIPELVAELKESIGVTPLALEFTILTAVRTNEAIKSTWSEFDLPNKTWTIPKERMKAERSHRVPLCSRAIAILRMLPREKGNDHVFIGGRSGTGLSNMAMLKLLKKLRPGMTVHGMRSSFKDWAREKTNFSREVSEAALAHQISDGTEAAYARGDLFDKRRTLMNRWAKYCGGKR